MKRSSYTIFSFLVCYLLACKVEAHVAFPVSADGRVVYRHTFKLPAAVSEDEAFGNIQSWIEQNPSTFFRSNAEGPNEDSRSKNKQAIDETFGNRRPLQSLEPEGKRMAVRGVVKYYGGENTCIHTMYIEYYMVVEVKNSLVTATISGLSYQHFNSRTYARELIYNWAGGKPCDWQNKIEHLTEVGVYHREMESFCSFMNADVDALFGEMAGALRGNVAALKSTH